MSDLAHSPTLAHLPTVAHVEALPGHAARLTLEDGTARTISSAQPRAYFLPLPGALGGVFAEDWKDPAAPVYHVPAAALPAFLAALHLRRVEA